VVEGPDNIEGQLRSLQLLYQQELRQARCFRTWFFPWKSPSTDDFEELRRDAHQIAWTVEQTMETDSVARTRDSSPHPPPVQMDCDDHEVTADIQPDGSMRSEAGTQRALVEMDRDEDAVTGDDGSTSSEAGGDAVMEITCTPVTETPGQPNPTPVRDSSPATPIPQRDSLPAITVHGAARETDSDTEMSADEEPVRNINTMLHTPSTSKLHRPHSIKLIPSAKPGRITIQARRVAVPLKRVVIPVGREDRMTSAGPSKRTRVEVQPRDVSASPEGCRHVLDIKGVVGCSVLAILNIHGDTSPKPEPANNLQRGQRGPVSVCVPLSLANGLLS
jgi:hypothetical protein